ncbi:MAG TPA: TIM barrel protein [Vicinamibacterales bacterium]|nr:TIM barrel protein [Vicinamibacterales bacterium]
MAIVTRREALGAAGATLALAARKTAAFTSAPQTARTVKNGRLKQSVTRWPYRSIALGDFCRAVADMGLTAIDLLEEPEWPVVRQYGLVCSMGYAGGGSIADGLNVKANHDAIVRNFEKLIPRAAAENVPNVITFFGNRRGMRDEEAIANSVDGLNRVKKIAEDHGVTICVELLNSKVDHKDYQGDHTAYGAAIVKAVNSPRVKLLYDIYHMQIMEGDVIRTIRDNRDLIAHFHTAGVPGRNELDDRQELNWRAIAQTIVDIGFTGFLAHEFRPTRDPLESLRQAIAVCDV